MDYLAHPYGVEFVGPFAEEYRVAVNGYVVPRITMQPNANGDVSLCMDHRYLIEGTDEEVRKWLPFLANAMAIGAGYSCHGDNSRAVNPYAVKLTGIVPSELPNNTTGSGD